MKVFFTLLFCLAPRKYGLVGTACRCGMEQSEPESSGSMPCGGGDIGMNVWVEDDDVFSICVAAVRLMRITRC